MAVTESCSGSVRFARPLTILLDVGVCCAVTLSGPCCAPAVLLLVDPSLYFRTCFGAVFQAPADVFVLGIAELSVAVAV